jgi:RHS repeat-associated protein
VILLAEHDKPSLAAKKKQRHGALKTATSTPKNRVWNFFDSPHGRPVVDPDLSSETATGSVQFSYETASGRGYYYTRDHLRSVREVCNSSGTIVSRYNYDPYGRAPPGFTTNLISGTDLATFQYAGYYRHTNSSLCLTKYRAYDSNTGRWLSRDPAGEDIGLNLYDYVANKSINYRDPLGLACEAQQAAVESALGNSIGANVRESTAQDALFKAGMRLTRAEGTTAQLSAIEQYNAAVLAYDSAVEASNIAEKSLAAARAALSECEAEEGAKAAAKAAGAAALRCIMYPAGLVPLLIPKAILDEIAPDPKHPPMG